MRVQILRKIIVVLIIIAPLLSYSGCKKQAKCGCDGDVLSSFVAELMDYSSLIYSSDGKSAYFTIGYDTYNFCNPTEMFETYKKFATGGQVMMWGDFYWNCAYSQQSSGSYSSYQNYYKSYDIHVTKLDEQPYGKK